MSEDTFTGIPEIDGIQSGTFIGTIGKLCLHKRNDLMEVRKPSTVPWLELKDRLETRNAHDEIDMRRLLNYLFTYPPHLSLERVHEVLGPLMSARTDLAMCAGTVDAPGVLVFVRRSKGMVHLPSLIIDGFAPTHYGFRRDGGFARTMDITLQMIGKSMSACKTMISVRPPPAGEFSFQQIQSLLEPFSPEEIETLKGEVHTLPAKQRSSFQNVFLRVLPNIMKVRALRDRVGRELVFDAYTPPSTIKVPPLEHIMNLDLKGHRLQEVTKKREYHSLKDVFTNASLMSRYAILILGANQTTGFGKSAVAKALACHYSRCCVESARLSRDHARVAISNTLDAARDITFSPGTTWILDEFSPADTESNVYMNETMLKCLFNPSEPCSLRARNKDVIVCEGIPRIITSNAASLEEWCGKRIPCTDPLRRKCIVFVVTKPLCSPAWIASLKSSAHTDLELSAATTLMQERFQASVPNLPAVVAGGSSSSSGLTLFGCPLRR